MKFMTKGLLAFCACIALSAGVAITGLALAQTSTPAASKQEPATTAELAEKVEIITRAKITADVPLNEPRAIDLGLVKVPGIEKSLTDGVTAKAYTRYVAVEGRKIGQVVLVGVEKGGRQEALNSTDFSAQFDLSKPQLDPAAEVLIKGDRVQLKEALERLAAEPEKKETEENTVASQQKSAQPGSTQQKQNELASGYQTPSAVQVAAAADPVESIQVSTEGCPIRIDLAQQLAIQQSKTVTTKDGAVSAESDCTDSNQSFPLQRSYSVCPDQVQLEAKTAMAQYKLFYVNDGGASVEVSDCTSDADKVFAIVERFDSCTVSLDYEGKTATPRSALVYANSNNTQVQVRGCEASETKAAVPLVATTSSCSIRHAFGEGKSYQQGTYIYTLDGVTYQAGACTDNGTVYTQTKVYTDNSGANVCQPIVDQAGKTVILQIRIQITVDGLSQYITDCTPDTSALAIQSTTDGCMDPSVWTHDITAGISYGQERFYYSAGGERKYITGCQTSTTTYQQEVENTGWQNHDAQLFAYSLNTVYITPATGRYNIKTSEVLPGAAQIPYEIVKTEDRQNGNKTYNGCDAYKETDKVEVWLRPDETEFVKKIGIGDTVGPINVCSTTLVATQRVGTGTVWQFMYQYWSGTYYEHWEKKNTSEDVQKFEVKNMETGQIVSLSCKFMHNDWTYYRDNAGPSAEHSSNGVWDGYLQSMYGPQYVQSLTVPPCPF